MIGINCFPTQLATPLELDYIELVKLLVHPKEVVNKQKSEAFCRVNNLLSGWL